MKPAGFDLPEVSEQLGKELIGATREPARTGEQFLVREVGHAEGRRLGASEVGFRHESTVHPDFRSLWS